ncbi:class I SAM-dependent methyltransferase [Caulobacter sp. NIBR2454]|uniref:class I SAM-dependent methyltransferase n=1 Tax=Caulobacter sp. NIBR2454 TaxID=3015996 RepID=UPI0022B5F74C|nr:methyltransferase [Caulobacter sp. NIBR2454]
MRRRSILVAVAAALLSSGAAHAQPDHIARALADPARPAADRLRDADRKPAEQLAWAGVKAGDKVGEYMPGAGYFTRILSKTVGPSGKVYAYVPSEIVKIAPKYLTDGQAIAADPAFAGNVVVSSDTNGNFGAPEPLDVVWTAQNYHDLHGKFAPPGTATAFNAAVFKALKPGGTYIVIDHSALPSSGLKGAAEQHRIAKSAAIEEVKLAGFVLESESAVLANANDPLTASVFDPSIRGKTDQFALKFKKPR